MAIIIYGKNAVRESLLSQHVKKLYVSKRNEADELVALARKKNVDVAFSNDEELTHIAKNPSHQGFVAMGDDIVTYSLDDIVTAAKKPFPLLVLLDDIQDPHNLGAILRTCDAFGVDGLILKSHGEVPLNGTVAKVSTGAINYVKVAVVANLSQAIEKLKTKGYWIVATDGAAKQSYAEVDYRCPIALVVGSEGFGIAPLVLKHSDFVVKIPMTGHVNSLNASVSAGILLAHIALSRQ